jgi:hypothetical protein
VSAIPAIVSPNFLRAMSLIENGELTQFNQKNQFGYGLMHIAIRKLGLTIAGIADPANSPMDEVVTLWT